MDSIYEQFKNPENAYRSKPFWAWNGALEEQELRRQIDVMKEMGFGGFFMHSRTGLQTQYLGKEWFSLVNACTEAAVEKGMEPWIYDEDRWPSGAAGGIATEQPRYRRKYLTLSLEKRIINRENILAVFCGRVDGYCLQGGYRQISPDEYDIDCLAEAVYLVFRIHTMACQSVYNGYTDLDRLDPEATALFLQVTHSNTRQSAQILSGILWVCLQMNPIEEWYFPTFQILVRSEIGRYPGHRLFRRNLRNAGAIR